jgi:hypothetical protein
VADDSGNVQVQAQADHSWVAPVVASQAIIVDLVELYFEIVYPIFPFFHQPSFTRHISRADYMNSPTLFAVTMAVCSLVSSRVRDGAVSNPEWDVSALLGISPDMFYGQAKAQLRNLEGNTDINTLRAHAVLAIASIQNGRTKDMHLHLGTYHTLVAVDALHDESNWPKDMGNIEREERRRLVSYNHHFNCPKKTKSNPHLPHCSFGPFTHLTYTYLLFGAALYVVGRGNPRLHILRRWTMSTYRTAKPPQSVLDN